MYRLRVLGGFALEGPPGAPAPQRPQRRGDAVLAVLAVCADRGCTRERLVALLWPESDEARSRQGLRDALYAIRRALGPGAVPSDGRLLRLDPVATSDLQAFTQALTRGRQADAARAYAGPLLDGFHLDDAPEFERWLDGERVRLAREYAEALEHLATAAVAAGDWHDALGWWGRAVEHDPLNSHFVLQHARAMAAIGDRANALKAAEAHARRLRAELDLAPDDGFLAAIGRIRAGELPAGHRGPAAAGQGPAAPGATPDARAPTAELPGAAGGVVAPSPRPARARTRRRLAWAAGVAGIVVLAAAAAVRPWRSGRPLRGLAPRTAIAVLPFRDLSADSLHAYVAAGLHDELLAQLARVASLRVIGPASVGGYQRTSKTLRQVAGELGVGTVVVSSVQVDGRRLRVIVQLLDPVGDVELWAERYDSILDDAFAVQSDIARRIVRAVGATLTHAEAGAIATAPTENSEAYQYYLQGVEYARRPGLTRQNFAFAEQLYERALALDPAFAPAHAALSYVHWGMYELRYDQTATRLDQARREADLALRLSPDLPQAHLAVGLTRFLVRDDFRGALDEFGRGLRAAPNDAELWKWIGRVQRHLGAWDSVLVAYERARALDPRDPDVFVSLGNVFHYLHRYPEAVVAYRHALALAPELVEPRLSMGWSYALWKAELDTLRAVLRDLPPDGDPGGGGEPIAVQRLELLMWERRPDSALAALRARPPEAGASAAARASRALEVAQALFLSGDTTGARAGFESAAALLDAAERRHPDDWGIHAARGLAVAWLGRRADARQEARWLERSSVYRGDPWKSSPAQQRVRILVRIGDADAALVEIARLLAEPSLLSVGELRLSPDYDPIRGDPRFQALLARYADPEAL